MNTAKKSIENIVEAIEISDPQLVNFIDAVFTLIDGADSSDPPKKLSLKQIQQGLWKLPILAMRSPIVLGLYAKYNEQITGTIVFPTPDTVVTESNGDLPSCEFDQATEELEEYKERNHVGDPHVEFESEYGTEGDEWSEQDYADFAKDNANPIDTPKATKVKK